MFISQALRSTAIVVAVTCSAFIASCSKSDTPQGTAPAAGGPGQAMPVPSAVLSVKPSKVMLTLDTVGEAEGAKMVEVRSRVQGILQKKLYQEGEAVTQGQVLFQIERAPFEVVLAQAKANLNQASARQEQTQREFNRLRPLLEQKAISQREVDDAESNTKLAIAAMQAAQAQVNQAELNVGYTTITAPVSGVTGRSNFSEGNLVSPTGNDGLLTSIAQTNPMWVRFSLSPSEVAKLPGGSVKGIKQAKLLLADGKEYPDVGRINFSANTVDTRLGTIGLRAEFNNANGTLMPGGFVRVRVGTGKEVDAIVVPQTAVLQNDQGRFVWVLGPESKAQPRPIVVGEWSGANWVIQQGLKEGDQVIIDNLLKIKPGAVIKPITPETKN